jgi:uncharacterized membrane protein
MKQVARRVIDAINLFAAIGIIVFCFDQMFWHLTKEHYDFVAMYIVIGVVVAAILSWSRDARTVPQYPCAGRGNREN